MKVRVLRPPQNISLQRVSCFFSSLVSFSDFSHLIREERRRDCAQAAPGRDWRDARRRGLELKHNHEVAETRVNEVDAETH